MNGKGWLAVVLAAAAGVVDATGLAGIGRYSSHMTGTTTHSMVGATGGDPVLLLTGGMAVLCFLLGAIGTGIVLTHPRAQSPSATLSALIGLETALVLAGGIAMAALSLAPWVPTVVVGFFAAAMGVQNAASTYLLSPYERTTHVTSNMTDFGCEFGMRVRSWAGLGTGKALASPDHETMMSALFPIFGFTAGAFAGAVMHLALGSWSGFGAAVLPALAALAVTSPFGVLQVKS